MIKMARYALGKFIVLACCTFFGLSLTSRFPPSCSEHVLSLSPAQVHESFYYLHLRAPRPGFEDCERFGGARLRDLQKTAQRAAGKHSRFSTTLTLRKVGWSKVRVPGWSSVEGAWQDFKLDLTETPAIGGALKELCVSTNAVESPGGPWPYTGLFLNDCKTAAHISSIFSFTKWKAELLRLF